MDINSRVEEELGRLGIRMQVQDGHDVATLAALAGLGVDVVYVLTGVRQVAGVERALLDGYRALPADDQVRVKRLLFRLRNGKRAA